MISNIIEGISTYSAAVRHISKHKLWGYVFLPGMLSIILAAIVISISLGLSDDLGGWIDNLWKWGWGKSVVEKIAQAFSGLLILIFGALIFKQILMVLLAPFMSILSAKVEEQLTGIKGDSSFSIAKAISEMFRGLRLAVRNIIRELLATIVLFIIGLIPLFTPFTTVLIFILQSYYAGFGNTDFTLERHLNYRDSVRFVQQNRGAAIGNGIVFMVLFLSVVGFFFALPLSTVASALQTLKRIESEKGI